MEQTMIRPSSSAAVKKVAIYLRKSRDETDGAEDVLHKHESRLLEYAGKMGYSITAVYKEIGTSQYIDARDEMLRLLEDVKWGMFHAVLVVDLDRLSRGDWYEFGRIQRIFTESNTLVITPQRTYDFHDDEMMMGVEHLVGRLEYKQIKKRLQSGKLDGAKEGHWVNGKPPFPYFYDRNTKNIVVDESKRSSYVLMKKLLLDDDMPCYKIAWELNKLGISSPGGKKWSENAVYRVLTSEVHVGRIAYGKTSGSGHKNPKKPTKPLEVIDRSRWVVNNECRHEIIKSEEEHVMIMFKLERRRLTPKEPRKRNFYPLTGLLFCGKCKRSMQFMAKSGTRLMVKTCQTHDEVGNRCYNQGIYVDYIYGALADRLQQIEYQIRHQTPAQEQSDTSTLELAHQSKRNELRDIEQALQRNEDMFLKGKFDEEKFNRYEARYTREYQEVMEALDELEKSLTIQRTSRTDEERLHSIQSFKDAWNVEDIDPSELNRLAKAVIDRIEYVREGGNIQLNISFR